jgi:hypothetical protein
MGTTPGPRWPGRLALLAGCAGLASAGIWLPFFLKYGSFVSPRVGGLIAEGQQTELLAYTSAFLLFRVSPLWSLPAIFFGIVARKQPAGKTGLAAGVIVLLSYLILLGAMGMGSS